MRKFFAAALAVFCLATTAQAASVNIIASENGGDVILTGSGSVDLTGTVLSNPGIQFPQTSDALHPNYYAGSSQGLADIYALPNFISFTPLSTTFDSLLPTGDIFGLQGSFPGLNPFVILPENYVSLDPISFSWTVSGQTIASLGLNFGTVGEFGNTTINLSAVPLPAPFLLVLSGLGGLALVGRRRKQA